jgi:hypothetical protein
MVSISRGDRRALTMAVQTSMSAAARKSAHRDRPFSLTTIIRSPGRKPSSASQARVWRTAAAKPQYDQTVSACRNAGASGASASQRQRKSLTLGGGADT